MALYLYYIFLLWAFFFCSCKKSIERVVSLFRFVLCFLPSRHVRFFYVSMYRILLAFCSCSLNISFLFLSGFSVIIDVLFPFFGGVV